MKSIIKQLVKLLYQILSVKREVKIIMIEFEGYLTGKAEKYFFKNSRKFGQRLILIAIVLLLPTMVFFSIIVRDAKFLTLYAIIAVILIIFTYVPKRKSVAKSLTPKRIFIEDDCIVCVADQYTESRFIEDAKLVRDFDEFYEIVFPVGKLSDKFICQKSLISGATLGDFESKFSCEIVKS